MYLNFILCLVPFIEPGIVLNLFLIFGDLDPQCSYRIVLIKNSVSDIMCCIENIGTNYLWRGMGNANKYDT